MKKIHSLIVPGALAFLALAQSLHAVPAFARQTGLECFACHTGSQSNLNALGRKFAQSSYMMVKEDTSESLLSGEKMGVDTDTVLNASIMLKARLEKGYDVVNGKGEVVETHDEEEIGANRGVYEMFKTSTAHLAGKVVSNVGTLLEVREKEGRALLGGKFISSMKVDDASYAGVTLYSTDNYGPFSGMETYNTGLYKPLRQFENHKLTNAAQAADLGTGSATGIQAYYGGESFFATIGAYIPLHHSDEIKASNSLIPFARLAYEQKIGDLNLIVGAYGLKGKATADNTIWDTSLSGLIPSTNVEVEREAYGFDMQLEGEMFSIPSMLTAIVVVKSKTTLDNPELMNYTPPGPAYLDIYGEPYDGENSAYSVSYEFYPTAALGLKLAYLHADDEGPHTYEPDKIDAKDKDAYSIGFDYSYRQNIAFTLEYSFVKPGREDIEDYSDLLAVVTASF
ncbi:MAG: hypothetical protein FP820_03595 [Sulfurimonas sp.]|nr:hypothetical protein [Sulfurimonas sp.]MBU3938008.1 hypothetical protein [bacterium]MBU4024046.1 hypothetical protein [bacterium]MBU4059492.1 hypothetical protein [bacterium]MBU4110870.1 hypothetical protein [bacterium]